MWTEELYMKKSGRETRKEWTKSEQVSAAHNDEAFKEHRIL